MKEIPMDLEVMTTLYEQRVGPFAKDVVITADVGNYLRANYDYMSPSNQRIGKLLTRPPFNSVPRTWHIAGRQHRGFVLGFGDRAWLCATNQAVMSYYLASDPLLM